MLWIIQSNLFIENKRQNLVDAVKRLGIPHLLVNLNADGLDQIIPDNDGAIITNGSVKLSKIAHEAGWRPGSFWSDDFTYEVWGTPTSPWHDLLLNRNATTGLLRDIQVPQKRYFVRPMADTKAFNGQLFTRETFEAFKQRSITKVPGSPDPDTKVIWAPAKTIGQEHRHYIVDGKVITSSRYKLAGQPNFKEGADQIVLDVVQHAIDLWQPARAFVLDTYISGDEIGIVETGCIGNAGLYEADLLQLVHALDSMPMDTQPTHEPKLRNKHGIHQ